MQTEAPPTPPAAPPSTCPSCGKPADPQQPFCLDCGRRIAHDYRRPPHWRIPIALTALVVIAAGVAAGFGITELTERDEGPDTITVRTGPGGDTVADPGEAPPAAGPTTAPVQPPAPATPPPPEPSGQPTNWPPGQKAYTVVLLTTNDQDKADEAARRAAAAGKPAGLFDSDEYKRFEPGQFVVFSGQFETVESASEEAKQLAGDYPDAYARFVEPR